MEALPGTQVGSVDRSRTAGLQDVLKATLLSAKNETSLIRRQVAALVKVAWNFLPKSNGVLRIGIAIPMGMTGLQDIFKATPPSACAMGDCDGLLFYSCLLKPIHGN